MTVGGMDTGEAAATGEKKRLVLESVVGFEFGDSILVWHIATDAYLCWYRCR
jgi:hypothetical protein